MASVEYERTRTCSSVCERSARAQSSAPTAVVDHVGAPHVIGRRFDYRYVFWARHNHALLLARNLGIGSREFRTWVWSELGAALGARHPNPVRRAARMTLGVAGVLAGVGTSLRQGSMEALRILCDETQSVMQSRAISHDPAEGDAVRLSAYTARGRSVLHGSECRLLLRRSRSRRRQIRRGAPGPGRRCHSESRRFVTNVENREVAGHPAADTHVGELNGGRLHRGILFRA